MNPFETIRFALRGVAANKLRSGLTVLGILIGVGAVILLVAVGNGSSRAIQASIERLGTNTLTIQAGGGRAFGASSRSTSLTPAMADALVDPELAPHVKSASPVVTASETATYDGTDHTIGQFIGTTPAYLPAANYSVAKGAPFTASDVTANRKVVLIGQTVADDLFVDTDPLGKQITVNGTLFTVVGVLANKGSTGFQDANDVAIAPVSAVRALAHRLRFAEPDPGPGNRTGHGDRSSERDHLDSECQAQGDQHQQRAVPDPQPGPIAVHPYRHRQDLHRPARYGRRYHRCWSAASASPTS